MTSFYNKSSPNPFNIIPPSKTPIVIKKTLQQNSKPNPMTNF